MREKARCAVPLLCEPRFWCSVADPGGGRRGNGNEWTADNPAAGRASSAERLVSRAHGCLAKFQLVYFLPVTLPNHCKELVCDTGDSSMISYFSARELYIYIFSFRSHAQQEQLINATVAVI